MGKTPLPVGVPKAGFMIESMVTATSENIIAIMAGKPPHARASWNAVRLADLGDGGIAFVAMAVNRRDRTNGRTFTLLHAFVHLMLGVGAVENTVAPDRGMPRQCMP